MDKEDVAHTHTHTQAHTHTHTSTHTHTHTHTHTMAAQLTRDKHLAVQPDSFMSLPLKKEPCVCGRERVRLGVSDG